MYSIRLGQHPVGRNYRRRRLRRNQTFSFQSRSELYCFPASPFGFAEQWRDFSRKQQEQLRRSYAGYQNPPEYDSQRAALRSFQNKLGR